MSKEAENSVQALKAHISINVSNTERSVEFYRKMLGIEPLKVRTGYAKFDVQNPPLNLAMNEVSLSGASTKSMQLLAAWRCLMGDGADVGDGGPR